MVESNPAAMPVRMRPRYTNANSGETPIRYQPAMSIGVEISMVVLRPKVSITFPENRLPTKAPALIKDAANEYLVLLYSVKYM